MIKSAPLRNLWIKPGRDACATEGGKVKEKQYYASRQDYLIVIVVLCIFALSALYESITELSFYDWLVVIVIAIGIAPRFAFKVSWKDDIWTFKGLGKPLEVSDKDLKRLEIDRLYGSFSIINITYTGSSKDRRFYFPWDVMPLLDDVEEIKQGRLGERAKELPDWRKNTARSAAITAGVVALSAAAVLIAVALIMATDSAPDLGSLGEGLAVLFSIFLLLILIIRFNRVEYVKPGEFWGTIILLFVWLLVFATELISMTSDYTPDLPVIIGYAVAFSVIGLRSLFAPGIAGSIIALIISIGAVGIGSS